VGEIVAVIEIAVVEVAVILIGVIAHVLPIVVAARGVIRGAVIVG
jgi:hypothetical protein